MAEHNEFRESIYTTPDKSISFFPHNLHGHHGYDVILRSDCFYLDGRFIPDLTDHTVSTDQMIDRLERM